MSKTIEKLIKELPTPFEMANELKNKNASWKTCSWHKSQRLKQVGYQTDEVGWKACRLAGAIKATGHEHS